MKPSSTSPSRSDRAPWWRRLLALLLISAQLGAGAWTMLAPGEAAAALRSPGWWDGSAGTVTTAASSSWHYRVPITIPNGTPSNASIQLDVDFAALFTALGFSGATLDVNSPRVADSTGALAPAQEFTDAVYGSTTDAVGNSRGEVRFLLPNAGGTYFLYFDSTANGAKAALASSFYIGGNFENSSSGTLQPPGWTVSRTNVTFDAQVRPSENPSITTNGSAPTGQPASTLTRTVAGTPLTGQFSYLLGARTNNEPTTPASGQGVVTMSRTITVPAANPGSLTFRYRVHGWDSNSDGNTTQYDYLAAQLVSGATVLQNLVGPSATPNQVTYGTFPFSPNRGTAIAASNTSGYGQYNGFTMGLAGTTATVGGQTVTRGAEPWFTVTQSLAAWAGQTITLRFTTSYTNLYRSWWHIDDVEWSVTTASLGSPQSFGAALQLPSGAATTTYYPDPVAANRRLVIRAQLDAVGTTGAVLADLYDPSGTLVQANIVLYNDGTRGDTAAGDGLWTNDGSGTPSTFTFPAVPTSAQLGTWTVVLKARDAGAREFQIPGQPASPVNGTNHYNVDTQTLSLQNFNTLSGRVYTDADRDGLYGTGDAAWSASAPGAPLYVKLVQGGAVLSVATPNASTGLYSFGNLRAGTYTVVPSTNNLTTDANPSLPSGWTQSQPRTVTFTTALANGQVVTSDIGLYRGDLVVAGRVLLDTGAGGATPLDGVQGATEAGLSAVVVRATTAGGVVLGQTVSSGDGTFSLGLPATSAGSPVVLSVQAPATATIARVAAGTTGGTLNQATGTVTFTPAAGTSYANVVFSAIPVAVLIAPQMKSAPAGTPVAYAHQVTVGATGSLSFTLTSSPSPGAPVGWTGVLYQDAGCTGALTGTESPLASPLAVTAGQTVCLVVRDTIPAAALLNQRITHTLTATLAIPSASYTQDSVSNLDITTVGTPQNSGLSLVKAVRNLTTGGAFGTSSQALPGQALQYQLTFRNDTATPVSNVQIYDSVPAYAVFGGAACGTMPAGLTCSVAVQPAGGATSGAIQWNLTGSVPSGASGTVTFDWSVSP